MVPPAFYLLLAIALGITTACSIAAVVILIKRSVGAAHRRLAGIAAGRVAERQTGARSLGVRIDGPLQIRGNGQLALYGDELVFCQYWGRSDYGWRRRGFGFRYRPDIGRRDLRVPRSAIRVVGRAGAFLGKATAGDLLEVEWRTPGGGVDAAAWQVADLDGWIAALGGASTTQKEAS